MDFSAPIEDVIQQTGNVSVPDKRIRRKRNSHANDMTSVSSRKTFSPSDEAERSLRASSLKPPWTAWAMRDVHGGNEPRRRAYVFRTSRFTNLGKIDD
ncbi:hypothetical protein RRSWK_05452 [Rhodopirellula sp. SWK7]|nr:hypothetical protein RRSWK_05452 [Rhodopirellula sp. SWK7]